MEQAKWPDTVAQHQVQDVASFRFGAFHIHLSERWLFRDGDPVPLGGRAFDILAFLVQRAGQVVRHDELVANVWPGIRVSPGTLRVHLAAVRKALGCRPKRARYIVNIPGRGYSFVAPVLPAFGRACWSDDAQGPPIPRSAIGALLEPSAGAAIEWLRHHPAGLDPMGPDIAEHLLATLNTLGPPVYGTVATRRDLEDEPGEKRINGTATINGSPLPFEARGTTQAEDPQLVRRKLAIAAAVTLLTCVAGFGSAPARAETAPQATAQVTYYRTATIDGVQLFYREAGPSEGPVVLLLHGFPTSSHMFRNLIPALSGRYRVIAPDYPGFGQSAAPDHKQFTYTFARYASLMDGLLQHLGAARYAMYVMDYGAPVGYRLALLHPDRVTALIIQNGNAYAEGLGAFWDPIKAYWSDGSDAHRRALQFLVAPETTKFQYTDGVADVARISPDNWVHDQALLDRAGNRDIQLDLFRDYGSNLPLYPQFQAFFRQYQPPTLIVWGKNDKIFPAAGASPYLRDLPKAELHLLDTGHFALEDKLDVMAPMIHQFLDRSIAPGRGVRP